ncbi:MAG: SBBP repeat-containing protein [Thermoplasmata archaeon]|nr:MAG: SBBP repeat-containing protein [Thermoplasmata archaeon]
MGKNSRRPVLVGIVLMILLTVQIAPFWEPIHDNVSFKSALTEPTEADFASHAIEKLVPSEPEKSPVVQDEHPYSASDLPEVEQSYFTENLGQWEDHIKFLAQTSFGYAAFAEDGIYYYMVLGGEGHTIKITFENAGISFPTGLGDCGFESNFFYGNDQTKWISEARSYKEVLYENVWPGIAILYYFKDKNLKYDIIVGEHSNPQDISFVVEGHKELNIGENGLEISISKKVLISDTGLVAFYEDGESASIQFKKINDNTYGFDVDKKDGKKLTIDPIVFSSSTFLGGSGYDVARDMELDSNGNIIILADTWSVDFPNTTGAYQTYNAGGMDVVITKMDHNTSYIIFSTYIGGVTCDFPHALDLDDEGYIYATGETWSRDFPTTNGTFQEEAPAGSTNVFVLKLTSSGSDLIYSTYVGSSYPDWATDIEILNGYAYVVGYTYSYDFPYVDYPINNAHGTVFFFILNQNASNLTHTAFWGGFQNEMAYSLEIDFNGDIVVGGTTNSMDFPTTKGVYQENATDWNNGFLLRYRPSTSEMLFSTYIGGSALDEIRSIYLDANSDIYFSGITNNPESSGQIPFPTTEGAYDRTYNGSKDAFIGKMLSDGTKLIFSTLYGSQGEETVGSIDVDSQGNIYFICNLNSDVNFTVTPDAFDCTFNQEDDVVFAVLNADCSDVLYSTYLGGNLSDLGETCLLSGTDEILLLGTTASKDFPSTNGSYQTENDGSGVLFISKFVVGDFLFLHEGWNLISIPLVQQDDSLTKVLGSISGCYDAVQWYDPTDTRDSWKHHKVGKPYGNDLFNLNEKMGFWIHITQSGGTLFNYTGIRPSMNQIISLRQGWNLVGYPSETVYNRIQGLNIIDFGIEVDMIIWFNANSQTWHKMGSEDYFVFGRGYYIHAKSECDWEVPL